MPTAQGEAMRAAVAARAAGENEPEAYQTTYDRAVTERHERLKRDACASYRAMQGWSKVHTDEDWERIVRESYDDFERGTFLLERLGAHRYLDPPLAAVLLGLRRELIEDHGAATAAELMLVDSVVLSYYQQLRINGWVNDLAGWLEREFFAKETLTAATPGNYPREVREVRGLAVEHIVERLVERLMPLLDRSNRMLLRNLKMLRALREGPAPTVSIGSAGQVNVAAEQVNTATTAAVEADRVR